VDELPANAKVAVDAARPSSGDPVANRTDPAKLLDVDVDEFAWMGSLISADWLGWLQGRQPI